jgi:hypothetical protein
MGKNHNKGGIAGVKRKAPERRTADILTVDVDALSKPVRTRGSQSSTLRLDVSTLCDIYAVYWVVSVTKTAQVQLKSGRVEAPDGDGSTVVVSTSSAAEYLVSASSTFVLTWPADAGNHNARPVMADGLGLILTVRVPWGLAEGQLEMLNVAIMNDLAVLVGAHPAADGAAHAAGPAAERQLRGRAVQVDPMKPKLKPPGT